jgi:hypothetical protein
MLVLSSCQVAAIRQPDKHHGIYQCEASWDNRCSQMSILTAFELDSSSPLLSRRAKFWTEC